MSIEYYQAQEFLDREREEIRAEFRQEIADLRAKLAAAERENERLRGQLSQALDNADFELRACDRASKRADTAEAALAAMTAERDRLQKRLDATRQWFKGIQEEFEDDRNSAKTRIDELTQERDATNKMFEIVMSERNTAWTRAERLAEATQSALDWLENAPIDYRNGVEHNGIDEGNVSGWKFHNELVEQLRAALAETETK